MPSAGINVDDGAPNEPVVAPPPPPSVPWHRRPFSTAAILAGLLLYLCALGYNYWSHLTQPALASYWYPEDTTLRYADRLLAFQAVRESLPEPLRFQSKPWFGGPDFDVYARQALLDYEAYRVSVANEVTDLRILATLAILEFEQGSRDAAEARLMQIAKLQHGTPTADRIRRAYAIQSLPVSEADADEIASTLPPDWVYTTLQSRFAAGRGDRQSALHWRESIGEEVLRRVNGLHLLSLLGTLLFIGGLVAVIHRWRSPLQVAELPINWSVREGLGMFTWGAAIGEVAILVVGNFQIPWLSELTLFYCFITGFPIVALIYLRHCRPSGTPFASVFGLKVDGDTLRTALILMLVQTITGGVLMSAIEWRQPAPSVIEGIDEMLVWGGVGQKVAAMLNATLGAGISEEILYRGVLFLTLRRWCGFLGAAAISSTVFAGIHFYSWVGCASVGVFGFLQAWSVERTRSLMPAIIVHIATNFLYCGWELLLHS